MVNDKSRARLVHVLLGPCFAWSSPRTPKDAQRAHAQRARAQRAHAQQAHAQSAVQLPARPSTWLLLMWLCTRSSSTTSPRRCASSINDCTQSKLLTSSWGHVGCSLAAQDIQTLNGQAETSVW